MQKTGSLLFIKRKGQAASFFFTTITILLQPAFCNLLFWIFFSKFQTLKSYQVDLIHILEWWVQIDWATETWPERIYKPIMAMGLSECLPFSWTTLRGKHYLHPIAIMGVVRYLQAWSFNKK